MRKLLFSAAILFCFLSRGQGDVLKNIETTLKNGSAKEFTRFCSDKVVLKMEGENNTVSRTETETRLRSFFSENPPTGFSYIHQGSSSAEGLRYSIGKYTSRNSSYRVVLLLKDSSGDYQVDTITLTKE